MKRFICLFLTFLLMAVMQGIAANCLKDSDIKVDTKKPDAKQDDDSSSNNGNGKDNQDKKR
ncbi:hypothetical protein QUF50_03495 [Thiotrichales bacterium HSG1]|nr:hypothetical protein [Thiotrichales bacterium HSG1]